MDFKNERLMMSKEEARNRAKELLNENQVDLITKYMFLEQQYNDLIEEKENQQKEFINFLEDNYKETQDIWYIKILQKYKSIIGVSDDKTN